MIRRFLALLACAAALPLRAQPGAMAFTADRLDATESETRAVGHARFSDGHVVVTADEIRLDSQTRNVITGLGHVIVTRGVLRLLADQLVYHRADGTFTAEHVRLGAFPYYVAGESAAGTATEITVNHATFTYGEPGPWQPALTAEKIVFSPGRQLHTENSTAGIGETRFLPFPQLTQDLHDPLASDISISGGFRSTLGAFVEAGLHLPVAPGMRLGADVGLFSSRGVMFGPAGTYTRGPDGSDMSGYFRSGFISDHGDRKTDILGRPVPENRAFVEWQHTQQITDQLTLDAQVGWWKDSEILRDFRPQEFFRVQEPDTFVESAYAGQNYFLSAFARFQPNHFDTIPERLPEVRFDLLPIAVGGGIYERFNASAAVLRETSPLGAPTLQSDRLDAYYALSRPIAAGDWFNFTPIAGARVTNYSHSRSSYSLPFPVAAQAVSAGGLGSVIAVNAGASAPVIQPISPPSGAIVTASSTNLSTPSTPTLIPTWPGNYTRTLGEIGFDAALTMSATFDYKNALWGIDGLRHLFTPRLTYRYIPEADKGSAQIPPIDATTFSTYLPPLGLGEARNIDTLAATNTLRLGFDNTLQTRDATFGSRDLLTFNVAVDLRFERTAAQRDVSVVQTETAFAPARWLQVDAFSQLTPPTGRLQEFNSGLTIRDANAWSLRFANNFLRSQIQDYHLDGRAQINERYDALVRLSYDARARRFNQQSYGIVQNLAHAWRVSYVVSFSSGSSRESHFGVNVQIEAIGF